MGAQGGAWVRWASWVSCRSRQCGARWSPGPPRIRRDTGALHPLKDLPQVGDSIGREQASCHPTRSSAGPKPHVPGTALPDQCPLLTLAINFHFPQIGPEGQSPSWDLLDSLRYFLERPAQPRGASPGSSSLHTGREQRQGHSGPSLPPAPASGPRGPFPDTEYPEDLCPSYAAPDTAPAAQHCNGPQEAETPRTSPLRCLASSPCWMPHEKGDSLLRFQLLQDASRCSQTSEAAYALFQLGKSPRVEPDYYSLETAACFLFMRLLGSSLFTLL